MRAWPRRGAGCKLNAKLQVSALAQFDAALGRLSAQGHIGLSLLPQVTDGHIATRLVLNALDAIPELHASLREVDQSIAGASPTSAVLVGLSRHGEAWLIECPAGTLDDVLATQLDGVGSELLQERGTWQALSSRLGLLNEGVWLTRTPSSPAARPTEAPDFVTAPFWQLRRQAMQILGSAILVTLLGIATPLAFQTFTDKILPFNATSSLTVLVVVLALVIFSTSVMECVHAYLESITLARFQLKLGRNMLSRLLRMDMAYFDQRPVGELTKLTHQVNEVAQFLVKQMLSAVVSVLSLVVVLPLLLTYSASLTAMVLAMGLLMASTIALALQAFKRRVTQAYELDADFQSGVIEMLKGIKTIKSLTLERHFVQRVGTRLENQMFGGFELDRLGHIVRAVVNFQSRLITVLVIFLGARAVFRDELSIGQFIAFHMLVGNLVNPLVSLVFSVHGWQSYKLAHAKLSELQPPALLASAPETALIDLSGDIVFEDVWFRYPGAENFALQGLTFTIRRGQMVGIVGESGSGKSTLFALLQGFYVPTKGRIRINGHDLRDVPQEVLRGQIAVVAQASFLFNQSVFENVRLGRLNAKSAEVSRALDEADCTDFVDHMPHRLAAVLNEDGANLSGGQRQRLAIARALLRNAPLLLFDEATSALDDTTERRIKSAVKVACEGKTGLLIAHRIQTLGDCTEMILLESGRLTAQGSPQVIAGINASFDRLWKSVIDKPSNPVFERANELQL
jgi:ABC-type bacteriocin/lantibiotic exporter with double-glycine peptidase domain